MSDNKPRKLPNFMEKLRAKASNNNVCAPLAKKPKKQGLFDGSLTAERKEVKTNVANKLNYFNGSNRNNPINRIKDTSFVKYDGNIHYLQNFFEVTEKIDELIKLVEAKKETSVPVAFDLEWPFTYENGEKEVAVMQICIDLEDCYVIQISDLKKIPATLIKFLYHPKIFFHGLFVKNDMRKLARDFPVFNADRLIEKCIELREFYNEVFNTSEKWSLKWLAQHTLGEHMNKSPHVRMSDWNCSPLTEIQLMYAATLSQ
jgi:3'-5' exonuclease